jgi:hypothetical protein
MASPCFTKPGGRRRGSSFFSTTVILGPAARHEFSLTLTAYNNNNNNNNDTGGFAESPDGERMFGRVSVDAILSVKRGCDPLPAVRALVETAEGAKIMKWIEFPASILVFLMIPGDVTSGSIYALDRKSGVWYWIDFEDSHYGGYSQEEFERLLSEGNLLALIERPGLLGSGLKWVVECGQVPVAT